MDTVNAKEPAILVDWEDVYCWTAYDAWLAKRQKNVKIVLLVSDPQEHDFEYDNLQFEPDVVLRNSIKTPMPDLLFKTTAVVTIQESSNLVPVIGVDQSDAVREMYEEAGIVFTASVYDTVYPGLR